MRTDAELTQGELAERMGVRQPVIARIDLCSDSSASTTRAALSPIDSFASAIAVGESGRWAAMVELQPVPKPSAKSAATVARHPRHWFFTPALHEPAPVPSAEHGVGEMGGEKRPTAACRESAKLWNVKAVPAAVAASQCG
jgi:hypothetical protein